jgi:transcriptional regulator with GAF, ATPase, and Fis domain
MIRNVLTVIMRSSEENARTQWTKTGQAKMADVMAGSKVIDKLSNNIITTLVKYLGSTIGVIYLANDDDDFTQTGSYVLSSHKYASKTIKAGEGTVDQAILDANTIIVSELPDDYIAISSGLGKAVPRHLIVVPVKLEGRVIGVVEIGSFEPFNTLQVEFVELVSDAIAIAVHSGQEQEKSSELLEESLNQSEQLQCQQEELRSANE